MGLRLIRYSSALVMLVYGFAKINGSQFTILDSELDKPMGQVSGFWLTWYYFGFSYYGTILALIQIAGAFLLTFRRTALLGGCILAAMLSNVILIDISYGVDAGATIVAMLLLAAMLCVIAAQRKELMALFWPARSGLASSPAHMPAKWVVRIAMLALSFSFTYWLANYNNRAPTPLDGSWDVIEVEPQNLAAQLPKVLFFEYNRAYMTVFKTNDGVYKTHHFEIDRNNHRIQIWEAWLNKGSQIFAGTYGLAGAELTLDGTWRDVGGIGLRLRRRHL
jgi:hypothetical protein